MSVINCLGEHSDKNINSGPVLSFDVVCTGSPVIAMLQKCKKNKCEENLRILSLIDYPN